MLKTFAIGAIASVAIAILPIPHHLPDLGDPLAFKTMEVTCHENGYSFESTTLVTPDGYVMTLGRIPGKVTDSTTTTQKPAVLFMHA